MQVTDITMETNYKERKYFFVSSYKKTIKKPYVYNIYIRSKSNKKIFETITR